MQCHQQCLLALSGYCPQGWELRMMALGSKWLDGISVQGLVSCF